MINKKQNRLEKMNSNCDSKMDQPNSPRIVIITEDLRIPLDEGAKKTVFYLINSFLKKGVKVSVFTRYENSLLKEAFHLPSNKFLIGCQFGRNLRAQLADVILYVPTSSGTIGAFIRAAILVMQSSNKPLALLNLQYRRLPKIAGLFGLHRSVNLVFTQSQNSSEVYRSFGYKTFLLPGGVDRTIFQPVGEQEKRMLRLKYGFQNADQIVLHVGHCKSERNVIVLSRLAKLGFHTILIASTSTVSDREIIFELRQSGVTVITDFVENIQHYYQMADCYLFPVIRSSSAIDSPLSVLEAMACNLPVVTTKFGTLFDIFQPREGLYYVDTEEEIVTMVKKAVQLQDCTTFELVSHYSWDNVASTILRNFQEAGYF